MHEDVGIYVDMLLFATLALMNLQLALDTVIGPTRHENQRDI